MAAHILVACGNGIATSTVVASKIKTFLAEKGVEVETTQTKLMEVPGKVENYDLLVTTVSLKDKRMASLIFMDCLC